MKLTYKPKTNQIEVNEELHDIELNYDRCFGRVLRKYDANVDEVLDLGDLNKYGLRTLLVFEIISLSEDCSSNIKVGDCVVVNSTHLLQVNITLNFLIDDMGNEYAVIPEELMIFKLVNFNKDDSEMELLIPEMVRMKPVANLNTKEGNELYFDLVKDLGVATRFKIYEIVDSNNNKDIKVGEQYIIDKADLTNMFPVVNDEFITTVNNFKLKVNE